MLPAFYVPISSTLKQDCSILSSFENKIGVAIVVYFVFKIYLFREMFIVSDTLSWIHQALDYEQKVKLLYIIDMGWLNLPEHDV